MAELNITTQNFDEEVINYTGGPVLVDFFAVWCGPCKMQGPIIEELAKELEGTKIKVGVCDVDQSPELAQKYGVMSIPTMVILKNGEVQETLMGLQHKDALKEKLEKLK
jgi:thioredoxin 1